MQGAERATVWDTFLYNGESVILLARLEALKNMCDYFIVVESLYTFSGLEKELDFLTKSHVLNVYGNQVKWVIVSDRLSEFSSWEYESWQRQQILRGLDGISHGDLLLLSDVDEIPNFNFIEAASFLPFTDILIAEMNLRIHDVHFKSNMKWYGTIAIKWDKDYNLDLQKLRMRAQQHWLEETQAIFKLGGNHITTLVNSFDFQKKIRSFSHTEFNVFPYNARPFLFVISKLGIQLNGSEILRLDLTSIGEQGFSLCSRKHKLDSLRLGLAKIVQPLVRLIFKTRVRTLSSPK
jgi:hypothetical protein